ncbi:motility associated factor glycosyltransferase family protein [Heliorestis acidaminivorans]|uniref:Motility associated factor glycosyltransferase family protein n=1 Tax=Heliorestis acidaminivorans TaxID=553427 RepID=A0A6I0F4M3_9FIRM|nr:6-hydroxymethylpterin diphosphokinase MptE-like protein [Heliorestis acidaminivorans]KAB2953627.1 motility associated factor glycosyltransferase family protein [Heliorestis acidaminivorans]
MKFELVNTKTEPTIGVKKDNKVLYLHSRYDPLKEAQRWAKQIILKSSTRKVIIVGMGAGYHIRALQKQYENIDIEIWDFNELYGQWLVESGLSKEANIKAFLPNYYVSENIEKIKESFISNINFQDTELLIYGPALHVIPKSLYKIKELLETFKMNKSSIDRNKSLLEKNYHNNLQLQDRGISNWIDRFKDRDFVLVSSGPSLDKQLLTLKAISLKRDIIIGSVGTALSSLANEDIKPHFAMISDPQDMVKEQLILQKQDFPLFYLSTANHNAVRHFKGKRYIVWQKGFPEGEKRSEELKEPLIATGGSVATCLLDLMVLMGAKRIALIGQDLAYTNNKSHSNLAYRKSDITDHYDFKLVKNYYQNGQVRTSRSLFSYLQWFENYISTLDKVEVWNCTEGGAYIKGCKHEALRNFSNQKPFLTSHLSGEDCELYKE